LLGGCPGRGQWWRELKEANMPPCHLNVQKWQKIGGFSHFLAYKSPKMLFFTKKYLTRHTLKTFFEEYIT
jgi:hypothetical protein